ncbi:methylated-DNA--protein-cysteine methyltransferase isoform X3 [Bubalus kerabau]|uniref:methylated-DNA--protein-cysteine methyltransferase isoform X3 n=1 Tax=Bubalus carabanensis TaxID=3119969 RepID=UPI00244EE712|nr:methylated-DNA--protein-cysteine methyltransferase isoform X3 [Bubalus carabanensis]
MRSTLCKHHLRCPCGCLVAASAGSTSRGEAPACLLLLLRLLCQPAEIKHVCSSCGSSSFLPASLLSPGLPWVQRTESERAVSSVRLPGQPPAYTGTIVLRAELNCTVSVLGRMDKTCEMKYKVVDSPLGKLEISGCEQGLHGIKLHGGKTPDTDSVVLSWTCCGNPLCLSCDCHPALHLRRGTCFYSLCFCSFVKVQLTWSLSSSVSDHFCYFPFPFSLLLLSISVLVTRLRHTHACCWSVSYALRVALISFHSLNSGISSWHIWDLNEQCLVF